MTLNSKGFTLIETLIVFSVFCLMSSASFLLVGPAREVLAKQMFFSQLQSDLLFAQQYALSRQEHVNVIFAAEMNAYFIRTRSSRSMLIERRYSDDIGISEGSMKLSFEYGADGNINKFGSLFVRAAGERYKLTFHIGRGRLTVARE